jgi:hypothetical protein
MNLPIQAQPVIRNEISGRFSRRVDGGAFLKTSADCGPECYPLPASGSCRGNDIIVFGPGVNCCCPPPWQR